ncbi:hypothetical protein Emtol_0434 [Emticicia oligotrophica DSM 17448]|uniref:Uncharacterized protein n=1 Tax=Emticicia oligotrophica (strain DSM 17448 / CIP 109782 / MTCC 6937 / GPTSA100-15) TaxID=929562 RepID=A0ABM5MWS2_EMTOG|nr:hypothetical protein Emtol_0434 [Emticicia oligotrophica DSM 17448]
MSFKLAYFALNSVKIKSSFHFRLWKRLLFLIDIYSIPAKKASN